MATDFLENAEGRRGQTLTLPTTIRLKTILIGLLVALLLVGLYVAGTVGLKGYRRWQLSVSNNEGIVMWLSTNVAREGQKPFRRADAIDCLLPIADRKPEQAARCKFYMPNWEQPAKADK